MGLLRNGMLGVLLTACGPIDDEDDYAESRAAVECAQVERCELGYFESEYRDRDDCVDERAEKIQEANDAQDDRGCSYVPEQAGHCVRRIRSFDCEEWAVGQANAACDLVWNCVEA